MIDYIHNIRHALNFINLQEIEKVIKLIQKAKTVYVIGNGGSQATAEHFCVDLLKFGNKKAHSICSSPLMTMTANDYSYNHGFSWALQRYISKGDLIIGISTSGKSENVIRALAENIKAKSVFITGLKGKDIAKDFDASIIVYSENTQVLEDIHLIICHMISIQLNGRIKKNGKKSLQR